MEKSLNRSPIIRKQQVLKECKRRYKKAKATNGDSQLPWGIFKELLLRGCFYTTHSNRRRHDNL